jgi:hypothetical protein
MVTGGGRNVLTVLVVRRELNVVHAHKIKCFEVGAYSEQSKTF